VRSVLVAGLAAIVAGTFLPWLRSGTVDRNSYSAGDALRRLTQLPSGLGFLMNVWPFLSLACAVAAALVLLHIDRAGLPIAAVCSVVAGATSAVVLVRGSSGLVRAVSTGPLVTLIGSVLVFVTVMLVAARIRLEFRRRVDPAWRGQ
jgi:hypothetical protein